MQPKRHITEQQIWCSQGVKNLKQELNVAFSGNAAGLQKSVGLPSAGGLADKVRLGLQFPSQLFCDPKQVLLIRNKGEALHTCLPAACPTRCVSVEPTAHDMHSKTAAASRAGVIVSYMAGLSAPPGAGTAFLVWALW